MKMASRFCPLPWEYIESHKTSPLSFVLVGRELIHHEVNEGSDFR